MTYRKKLIEVSLPLAAINAESAREKSIRHGHPSTLHLWWARRPLAACRAVLFSSLVDDPDSDPQYRKPDGTVDEEMAGAKRADLFNLIEELVAWENSNNLDVIRSARAEIARCVASRKIELKELDPELVLPSGDEKPSNVIVRDIVMKGHCRPMPMGLDRRAGRVRFSFDVSRLPSADVVNAFLAEHAPPVLDPFAGGGSIPLEAQRLGLRAYASDLNPIPVLINKALIEIPPKFAGRPPVNPEVRGEGSGQIKGKRSLIEREWPGATGLAEDVRYYGKWMRDEAEKRIGHLYPKVEVTEELAEDRPDLKPYVGQKLTVVAWLWARNTQCPNPACGVRTPLARSFVLYSRGGNRVWAEVSHDNGTPHSKVRYSGTPRSGTVGRRGAECVACEATMDLDYIRDEGQAGRIGYTLLAIVAETERERVYLSPTDEQLEAAASAKPCWTPETRLPEKGLGFRVQRYGLIRHSMLHTQRQLATLATLTTLIPEVRNRIANDMGKTHFRDGYAQALITYLAMCVDKTAARNNALCLWEAGMGRLAHGFGMQTVSMKWDFAETNPFAGAGGDFLGTVGSLAEVLDALIADTAGKVIQRDAADVGKESETLLISTDPPYYDNIGYADLSDLFYVWLRQCLIDVYPDLLGTVLTPKQQELIADEHRHGGKDAARHFFEEGLSRVFLGMRNRQDENTPTTVFYAFKQSESDDDDEDSGATQQASTGWETMLEALSSAGYVVTGTWPMRTEQPKRMRDKGANALASSIVLVCRPRPTNAVLATRKEFITVLRRELPESLRNLQHGNIAPVDLAQSAIGPGMAVFTRYAKVLESDGSAMSVRTALGLINQSLDEVLAEQEGEFDGDTRWALSWFEQFGMDEGPFGDAETLSKAKNTAIKGLEEAGIIVARSGKVRLLRRNELPKDWNPATDKRLTVWEVTQHLIQRLDEQGETGAADLVGQLGGIGEVARDLAYRLYSTCDRKKWAQDALAYNSLVVAWPELTKLAHASRSGREKPTQSQLF